MEGGAVEGGGGEGVDVEGGGVEGEGIEGGGVEGGREVAGGFRACFHTSAGAPPTHCTLHCTLGAPHCSLVHPTSCTTALHSKLLHWFITISSFF